MADPVRPADYALADHLAEVILDRYENDELADCFDLREGGEKYLGRIAANAALAYWEERGFVIVQGKEQHKGPRAQVITPSDGVSTREGQILAVALHAAEERELDLLAKIGRLERQIDGTGVPQGKGESLDG